MTAEAKKRHNTVPEKENTTFKLPKNQQTQPGGLPPFQITPKAPAAEETNLRVFNFGAERVVHGHGDAAGAPAIWITEGMSMSADGKVTDEETARMKTNAVVLRFCSMAGFRMFCESVSSVAALIDEMEKANATGVPDAEVIEESPRPTRKPYGYPKKRNPRK